MRGSVKAGEDRYQNVWGDGRIVPEASAPPRESAPFLFLACDSRTPEGSTCDLRGAASLYCGSWYPLSRNRRTQASTAAPSSCVPRWRVISASAASIPSAAR